MKLRKSLFLGSTLLLSLQANAYNVVERYKIIDDQLKTEQMLRPIDHDFFLDINAAVNKNVTTFISDISDASNYSGTTTEQITNAQTVLHKYDKSEQTIKLNLNLGFPIFSFSIKDLHVKPNFRVYADVGANIGVRSQILTVADALSLFNTSIPAELSPYLSAAWWDNTPAGANLFSTTNCDTYFNATVAINTACKTLTSYNYDKPDTTTPNLNLFAKVDARAGLYNQYTYGEHFFGDFNLYALSRTDIYQIVNYAMVANGQSIELPSIKNTQLVSQLDYRLGYRNTNYTVLLGVEDVKLTTIQTAKSGSKELSYGYDPMIRLHADALYKYNALSIQPFAGFHVRSGYNISQGAYAGAGLGAHVWGDRLGVLFRTMVDKEYITLTPRIKLWLFQLEYSYKAPMKTEVDEVKLTAIQSVDLRLFF
jgi:hypothetical protein